MTSIRPARHHGLDAIDITSGRARMTIVHEVGPRIAAFGSTTGDSLLFWDEPAKRGRGSWRLYGGHRLWVTRPGADESEETYLPDNARCRVRRLGDGVRVVAPPDASAIEKTLTVRVIDSVWIVSHRLRNVSDMLWTGGAWALTCTRPGASTRYRVPLGAPSGGWDTFVMVVPRRWGGTHTSRLADPQFRLSDDALELRARGREAKRMVRAPAGRLEMRDATRGTFVKTATHVRGLTYPLDTNVAMYVAPRSFMVELETMSPFTTLLPGESLLHVERWTYRAA